jgi:hypothetical protein
LLRFRRLGWYVLFNGLLLSNFNIMLAWNALYSMAS